MKFSSSLAIVSYLSLSLMFLMQSVNPNRGFPSRLRNLFGLRSARAGDADAQEIMDDEESTKVSEGYDW